MPSFLPVCFAAAASIAAATAAPPAVPAPATPQDILPFSEIKAGMTGVGRTVFSGTKIEDFQVEVIGTLENIAPHRNLILARLSGGPLAGTGVLAGMSGSPVYFNGRLAGAVAYSWGFAREPIAGVVPIQEMLSVESHEAASAPRAAASPPPEAGPAGLAWLRDPSRIAAYYGSYFEHNAMRPLAAASMDPIRTPLLFSGFPSSVVDELAPDLARAGLVAVQGGSTGRAGGQGETRIEPGGGVGLGLVRGDVEISAVCTVTHREGDRIWACGHPLLSLGPTEVVMTTATVSGLLPSLEASFKFASAGEDVGVFRQDRSTAVFGYVGKKPRTIPVRIELQPDKGRPRRLSFDITEDPFLAPYLLYAALNAVLSSEEKDYGDMSFTYKEGSVIRIAGEDDIALKNLYAGDMARLYATGTVAFITQILLDSEYRAVHLEGIDLVLGASDERRTARLERAWVSRDHVKAGETLQVAVGLKPFRGPEVTREINITVPQEVTPGRLLLQVGDALDLSRTDADRTDDFVPRDLKQLIFLINHLRSNDRLYAILTRSDNGLLFQGERLPNLPPSVSQVMARPQTRGNYLKVLYRGVAEESVGLGYAVEGYRLLSIDVEE
ncbi:MAG TPA: SpoIVB peptidase S55 domain-containing protein [Patescibacteria group bacterium]|nr:SpoIVB peptidase S55 domain-containing protein [Patescibacteria group bacterium]